MVAAASLLSAAAAALSVRGAVEQQDAGAGGSSTRGGLARGGGGGSPLSLAAVLASSLGFAPTAAAGSPFPFPFSMPPGLRWLVPAAAGADDDEAIPGEGLVLLALGLLGLSLLCAYPNQYLSWCVGRLWRRGGGGQAPWEVSACSRACVGLGGATGKGALKLSRALCAVLRLSLHTHSPAPSRPSRPRRPRRSSPRGGCSRRRCVSSVRLTCACHAGVD